MKNVLLLSFDGTSYIIYDEEPEFKTIVNTWKRDVTEYPHDCEGVFYSPTQRHGEAMYIQSKILRDLNIEYDYVASFCHDLKIKVSDINRYFKIAHENGLDCFGPSMTRNSYVSHAQFVNRGTRSVIPQEWIEIMAIGLSRKFYEILIYHLDILYGKMNLVGGWGLDNKLIKQLIFKNKLRCAMIDEIQVEHFVKVTRGEIKWRNGMTSRDCMSFFDRYITALRKGKTVIDKLANETSSERIGTRPFYEPANDPNLNKFEKILYVRLSCLKEKPYWDTYRRSNINQIILCGVPDMKRPYHLVRDVLYLRCPDTYEFLPTKMIMAFNAILREKRFKNVSHILKLDNDIDIDYVWNYVTDNSKSIKNEHYLGGRILNAAKPPGCKWHFDRVPKSSPWSNKRFFEKEIPFCSGGYTYILSRKSLKSIRSEFSFTNIDKVNERYVLEDMMVGLILERNNIHPKEIDIKVTNTSAVSIKKKESPSVVPAAEEESEPRQVTQASKNKKIKNLVVQIYFDNKLITDNPKTHINHNRGPLITAKMKDHSLFEDSIEKTRKYAQRCGADYVLFDKPVINYFSASMERMRLIEEEEWAEKYDNILYVDGDVIIKDTCPNLFDLYPQNTLRVCPTLMSKDWLLKKETTMVNYFGEKKVLNNYFNGGVILFHKSTLNLMRGKLKYRDRFTTYAFDDQSELNWVAMEHDVPITMMDRQFNCKPTTKNGKMLHYLGAIKRTYKSTKPKDLIKRRSFGYSKLEKGVALVIRYSQVNQKGLWDIVKDLPLDELIVCCDPKLDRPYRMIDGVLYVKTTPDKQEHDILRTVTTMGEFKKYTHFGMIDINKNPDKYFKDLDLTRLKRIHLVGDSLRSTNVSKLPFIASRRAITFYKKSGVCPTDWRVLLNESGLEVFNFDFLRQ